MILVTGGAFQGKLDWVKKEYGIKDDEIFYCTENGEPDFSRKVFYRTEELLKCRDENYFKENTELFRDKIIICRDISQGIVPMDKDERAWREKTGRAVTFLASRADRVVRIFCGLPQDLKKL